MTAPTGMVASGGGASALTSPEKDSVRSHIQVGNNFFPSIDPIHFEKTKRLDGTVTPERVRDALISAIAYVLEVSNDWVAQQKTNGVDSIDRVDARTIDGTPLVRHHYICAVYSYAKAGLLEQYRDYDTSASGQKKSELLNDPIADELQSAHAALRAMRGLSSSIVELL